MKFYINFTTHKHCINCYKTLLNNFYFFCNISYRYVTNVFVFSGIFYAPFVCRKCGKKRAERKEIITEIVETELKYGRDLQIILEEFRRPILKAGFLTQEQLSAIFLNVEELLEHNVALADKLKDGVDLAQVRLRSYFYSVIFGTD